MFDPMTPIIIFKWLHCEASCRADPCTIGKNMHWIDVASRTWRKYNRNHGFYLFDCRGHVAQVGFPEYVCCFRWYYRKGCKATAPTNIPLHERSTFQTCCDWMITSLGTAISAFKEVGKVSHCRVSVPIYHQTAPKALA